MPSPPTDDPLAPLPPLPVAELPYDALLVVGFGGPEGPDDVLPFLENVLRGRNVPRERMLQVAEHYYHFGGVSPLNDQVRDLLSALRPALDAASLRLPLYWGNRNWHPLLPDTLAQMASDGRRRALAIVLSSYSSYSGCRQYRENIRSAQEANAPLALRVDKLRIWYNHPGWIASNVEKVAQALDQLPPASRSSSRLAFTAHSIPSSMADGCDYQAQLHESARWIAETLDVPESHWRVVYQSRSGRPQDPWLEPDILDHLRQLHQEGATDVVVHPLGFLSDHMEVLYDLDHEAAHLAQELGLRMVRADTVGSSPSFIRMLVDLIRERVNDEATRPTVGPSSPRPDACAAFCCPAPRPRP